MPKRSGTPRHKDRRGERYGRLVAIEFAGRNKWGGTLWECRCDCGKTVTTKLNSLLRGDTKSCGCLHSEIVGDMQRKKKGVASFNALYYSYQNGSRLRHLEFTLSEDEFRALTIQNCYYCGQEPSQRYGQSKFNGYYIYNGVDRLDPSKGYVVDNCVTSCGTCNFAKQGLSAKEFIKLVKLIYEAQRDNGRME